MTQEVIEKLNKKIIETDNAHEAAAWAEALRFVVIVIGIAADTKQKTSS